MKSSRLALRAAIPKVMPKSLPALVATKGGTKQPARLLNLKRCAGLN
jgi:hypothetical protein